MRSGAPLTYSTALPVVVVVQGRHEAVLGFERDDVGARPGPALEVRIDAGLERRGHQRALGRVALDEPCAAVSRTTRVVAQQAPLGHLAQQGVVLERDLGAIEQERAARRIADAGDARTGWRRVAIDCTVISLRVSVPVLSEQISDTDPSVSTAGRRRMMALRRAMRCTPIASVIVMIAGRPSGIAADGEC